MLPLASTVAISPRKDVTRPRIRTVWLVNVSRYLAFMRGVASEAILGQMEVTKISNVFSLMVSEIGDEAQAQDTSAR